MAPQPPSLTALARFVGDGWCLLVRRASRGEALLLPGASLGLSGGALAEMNALHVWSADQAPAAVRRGLAMLREKGLAGVVYAPPTVAVEIAPLAEGLGLTPLEPRPLMYARAADARRVEDGYAVERVMGIQGFGEAAETLDDAFGAPPGESAAMLGSAFLGAPGVDLFLARHHGRGVAVAGTVRLGAMVGIYRVATRLTHRRRGAASAAVSAAIDYHVRGGAHAFGLMATVTAEPLAAGLGFATAALMQSWRVEAR